MLSQLFHFGLVAASILAVSCHQAHYILYDVSPGEGFNLRRDVYLRMANMVKYLNSRCAADSLPCSYTLVVPPWSNLPHWKTRSIDQSAIKWEKFFDLQAFNEYVPMIDFHEWVKSASKAEKLKLRRSIDEEHTDHDEEDYHAKEAVISVVPALIDRFYQLQNDPVFFETGEWKDTVVSANCTSDFPVLRKVLKKYVGKFWGYSDEVAVSHFECLNVASDVKVFGDFLFDQSARAEDDDSSSSSIFLNGAEIVISGEWSEWSTMWWSARKSMKFSDRLLSRGLDFLAHEKLASRQENAGSVPDDFNDFIAVHWRRGDFARAHHGKTPAPSELVAQVKKVADEQHLSHVFLATDSLPLELEDALTAFDEAKLIVHSYKPTRSDMLNLGGDAAIAIIDQIICSHAKHFIGTKDSTFSMRIMEEREILGFPTESTFNGLCPVADKPCDQPTVWKDVTRTENTLHDDL